MKQWEITLVPRTEPYKNGGPIQSLAFSQIHDISNNCMVPVHFVLRRLVDSGFSQSYEIGNIDIIANLYFHIFVVSLLILC